MSGIEPKQKDEIIILLRNFYPGKTGGRQPFPGTIEVPAYDRRQN